MNVGSKCIFYLAVLKGLIEHGEGTAYFGSFLGYRGYFDIAVRKGLVDWTDGKVTELGKELYALYRLADLPQRKGFRAYLWDWSKAAAPPDIEDE